MKLKNLFWNWTTTIKTFPVSHILLLVFTIIWIWEIEWFIDLDSEELIASLILTFILSCYGPLFSIHSNFKKKNIINLILQIWSIILWWIYYIILNNIELDDLTYSEILPYLWIFPIVFLWIPLVIALLHRKQDLKTRFSWTNIFISIVFGFIAWSIIRWWISGALASIEALFDVDIDWDLYGDIWFISEIFLTGFFIFNFYITSTESINQKSDFKINPSRLRHVFWLYIFVPLSLIYLAIFWTYWIKVLVTWDWPKWIIVWLWILYFALWTLSSYIIYPDKAKTNETINRILHISFIFIAFIMIWAIRLRINQYWITINRCFVCYIIAFIIIFSALSLIFSNKRVFSFISTLGILTFLAIYGRPINASNISFTSQINRLETLLSKENLSLPLKQWDLKNTDNDSAELIVWSLNRLAENYNSDKIINKIVNYEYEDWRRWFRQNIRDFLGVETDYDSYYYPKYKYRNYNQYGGNKSIDVSWFSKLYNFEKYYWDTEGMILTIKTDEEELKIDLSKHIDELKEKSDLYEKSDLSNEESNALQQPALILEEENYKFVLKSFSFSENLEIDSEEWPKLSDAKGYILTK